MIKNIFLILLFLAIGFLGTVCVYLFLTKEHSQIITPPVATQFSLEKAPSESITGTIAALSGQVLWTSRTADTSLFITHSQSIQQGEELATGNTGKATIAFPGEVTINMAKNSDVNIIQTLPANIVIEENNGNVIYEKIATSIPISVRGLDLLVNIDSGQSSIAVDKTNALVNLFVKSGSVTVAYTDTNSTSHVISIKTGQTITFNNNTKTID